MVPSQKRMEGSVAVVTGASSGIGAATVRAFAAQGARVALVARSARTLEALAREIEAAGAEAAAIPCDVSDWAQVQEMAQRVRDRLGRVDVLVNNAGVGNDGTILEMPVEALDETLAVNLRAPFLVAKAVVPLMTPRAPGKPGAIVNVASVAGAQGVAGLGAYAASKAGLRNLSDTMAQEFAPLDIRVVCVNPGYVATPMVDERPAPGSKMIQPDELAQLLVDLCAQPPSVYVDEITVWPRRMYTQ